MRVNLGRASDNNSSLLQTSNAVVRQFAAKASAKCVLAQLYV